MPPQKRSGKPLISPESPKSPNGCPTACRHASEKVDAADQIIALDAHGRIEAQGTHEQLLAAQGTYAEFWELLHAAQGWQLTQG